jgi:hypothetical protein
MLPQLSLCVLNCFYYSMTGITVVRHYTQDLPVKVPSQTQKCDVPALITVGQQHTLPKFIKQYSE